MSAPGLEWRQQAAKPHTPDGRERINVRIFYHAPLSGIFAYLCLRSVGEDIILPQRTHTKKRSCGRNSVSYADGSLCTREVHAAGASPRPTAMDIVCAYRALKTRKCKKTGVGGRRPRRQVAAPGLGFRQQYAELHTPTVEIGIIARIFYLYL